MSCKAWNGSAGFHWRPGSGAAAQARLGKAYVSFWIASVLAMRIDHQAEGGKLAFAAVWRLGFIKGHNGKNRL